MKLKHFLFLTLFFLASCRDDDGNTSPCELAESNNVVDEPPQTIALSVNPNNPDEVAILIRDNSTCCDQELVIFNLSTKETRKIYNGRPIEIDWGAKDWILFLTQEGGLDYRIYKIRPSGDSLSLLQSDSIPTHISWNKIGDQFLYTSSPIQSNNYTFTIANTDGTTLKYTENPSIFDLEWHHDSYMTTAFHHSEIFYSIKIYDNELFFNASTNSKIAELDIPSIGFGRQADWLDDQTMIISASSGFYTVDFSDLANPGELTLIRTNDCPSINPPWFTVHRATKKVIAQYFELEKVGNKVVRHTKLMRMNEDGSGVEIFEVPD